MKTDKTLRVFSIIAAISFLLTAAVEFIPALNTSFIWIVLTLSFAVFCVALGIILAIGKSDKLHLRILSVASFLSGLSLAVRTAINYFISPPPIIGSLFDIMRVEIFYTAVYFVLFTYFGVLFIYASYSHKKFNNKIFLILCILPAIVSFIVLLSIPYIEYMMLTLISSFLFMGLWLRKQCVIINA